jgi:hypothetical protein
MIILSKVNNTNKDLGTYKIKNYKEEYDIIQDNLEDSLLIKLKEKKYIYNYKIDKYYNYDKIKIYYRDEIIIKQIDSFDQNNILISNKIRRYVLLKCKEYGTITNILGIGGEYYLYFKLLNKSVINYIGISNHKSIIEDANYNIINSKNYLVDYNNLKTYPSNNICYDIIILNVVNIHNNIIKYINSINYKLLIIISCKLSDSKLKTLNNNFQIIKIKYIILLSSLLIRVIIIKKK